MATVGIVGGLGPEATIDYYRRILAAWEREDPSSAPSIVIDSLDPQRALKLVAADRAALADYLFESLQRLAGAGVDFAVLSANTASHRLRRSQCPFPRAPAEHCRDVCRRSRNAAA